MILASLQDIAKYLKHPTPRSPLAPCTDSRTTALQRLIAVLTTQLCPPDAVAAPSLRVPQLCPPDTVAAPSLRVPVPVPINQAPPSPFLRVPTPITDGPPSPKVHIIEPEPSTETPPPEPPADATPPKTLQQDKPTFGQLTGPSGQRRRRSQRNKTTNQDPLPCPVPLPVPEGRMINKILEDEYERQHGRPSPTPFGFDGCVPQRKQKPRAKKPAQRPNPSGKRRSQRKRKPCANYTMQPAQPFDCH
jgi:hypothetical protein